MRLFLYQRLGFEDIFLQSSVIYKTMFAFVMQMKTYFGTVRIARLVSCAGFEVSTLFIVQGWFLEKCTTAAMVCYELKRVPAFSKLLLRVSRKV